MKIYKPEHVIADELILATSQGVASLKEANDVIVKATHDRNTVMETNVENIKKCNVRKEAINREVGVCNAIIDDIQHFIELYALPITDLSRLAHTLRETLRKRRALLDNKALISIALVNIGHLEDNRSDTMSISERENYHKSGSRTYTPKAITLEEALGRKENAK